jgi:hypothetical protein
MTFKLSKKVTLLLGLLSVFIIFMGYVTYREIQGGTPNLAPTPTSSPTPTEYPNNSSSTPLVTNYSVTIPEIYRVNEHVGLGFGVAEINLKFIAPSPTLQKQLSVSEADFSSTKLPFTLSTSPSNTTSSILPAIFNGTTIVIKVDVYQFTMDTQNPRILAASKEWNITEYEYT